LRLRHHLMGCFLSDDGLMRGYVVNSPFPKKTSALLRGEAYNCCWWRTCSCSSAPCFVLLRRRENVWSLCALILLAVVFIRGRQKIIWLISGYPSPNRQHQTAASIMIPIVMLKQWY
jgi:hypothetical protein